MTSTIATAVGRKATRPMRIIAIPLTRAKARSGALTFYHFQLAKPVAMRSSSSATGGGSDAMEKGKEKEKGKGSSGLPLWWGLKMRMPEEGVGNWITGRVAHLWAGFGKAEEGNWKLKIYRGGEKLMDRMEFEELALKSIDPKLGPKSGEKGTVIPLLYAPSMGTGSATLAGLRKMSAERIPSHRRGFWIWAGVAPLMAPFMIVPIIPNLPFFFCAWRAWSHYRAWKGSEYLTKLIEDKMVVPEESEVLDGVYKDGGDEKKVMLLEKKGIEMIERKLELGESGYLELSRAVEQANSREIKT